MKLKLSELNKISEELTGLKIGLQENLSSFEKNLSSFEKQIKISKSLFEKNFNNSIFQLEQVSSILLLLF